MAANFLPLLMGREKGVGFWPHALTIHYPTVMRTSIKEWHHEAKSLFLL